MYDVLLSRTYHGTWHRNHCCSFYHGKRNCNYRELDGSARGICFPVVLMIHKLLNRIIVWNFHSLLVMIQMCFSFMLTDSDCDMKLCKHCGRAFIASRKGNEFCSPKCKNQYNVYKTRARKKEE